VPKCPINMLLRFHCNISSNYDFTASCVDLFFFNHGSVHRNSMLMKIQPDATICRYLFSAKSLYMFRVSQHPSSGVLKTVTATSGRGHNTGTAPTWPDRATLERSSCTDIMTCTGVAVTVFSTPDDGCCDTRNM